jgi:hypothetical protein
MLLRRGRPLIRVGRAAARTRIVAAASGATAAVQMLGCLCEIGPHMLPLTRLLGQRKINMPGNIPIAVDTQLSGELLRCTRMLVCHGFLFVRLSRATDSWKADSPARGVPLEVKWLDGRSMVQAFSKSFSHSNSSAFSAYHSNSALKA